MEVAGANRRWRWQFRCRGSRRESAVAQLFSLGHLPQNDTTTYITAKSASSVSPESNKDSHLCLRDAFRFIICYPCGMGFSSRYRPRP